MLTVFTVLICTSCTTITKQPVVEISTNISGIERIDKYGGLHFDITSGEFLTNGFAIADIVSVAIAGNEVQMPIVTNYRHVDTGKPALVAVDDPARPLFLTYYYGSAATVLGIAHKFTFPDKTSKWRAVSDITFPLPVRIKMAKKGGYAVMIPQVEPKRTNNRADYPRLSDAEFANFREVNVPNISTGILFRSSSPTDPSLGRCTFADVTAKAVEIKTVINMVDTETEAHSRPGWSETYVSKCDTLFIPMGVDVTSSAFARDLVECLRFMTKHDAPYLIHCKEGKDRTGFACAVIEMLLGASYGDVEHDYLTTFANYYGTDADSSVAKRYAVDLKHNISKAFCLREINDSKLPYAASDYLMKAGMTSEEIQKLKEKFTNVRSTSR